MSKKKAGITIIIVIIIAVAGCIGRNGWKNRKIVFADENMGKVICGSIYGYGKNVTTENVTWEQLGSIESLNIGYSGYYTTIKDIGKCRNLERLSINSIVEKYSAAYELEQGEISTDLSEEEIEKLQEELAEVLPKLSGLTELHLADLGKCNWTTIDFLKGCSQLEELDLYFCGVNDYSTLKECKKLKSIFMWKCNISSADDIIGLENIEYIIIGNTPLGDKPEEIKKLQEAYPDAVVDVANYEEEE